MRKRLAGLILACLLFSPFFILAQQFDAFHYYIQKKVTCKKAAVVCAHPLASRAGIMMLQQGGNAVDAAIATQLALAVVFPGAGNIGGGGFMVAHLSNGKNITIDYREKAPSRAKRDMYLDSLGNPVMALSQEGHLSSGVPGTIAGIFAALKYAKLPIAKLISPAIELAENGFALTDAQARSLNAERKDFLRLNAAPTVFVRASPWKSGDTLTQKDLAATLIRIRDHGQKGFYGGETARLIVEEMKRGQGIIGTDDLLQYQAKERTAIEFDYKDFHIVTMPLPSSGGIILEQLLKMTGKEGLRSMGFQTPGSVQLMVEAERRAFGDRAEYMGDADFVQVPVKTLVSDAYIEKKMQDYKPGKAGNSRKTGAGMIKESEETTHFSVVDAEGNAVAVTTTLNNSYGSKIVVQGAGFILNDEMDDFSVKPGVPNMYGALGNEKNAITPGKRMLSSMTPTIVLKNGQPYLVVGTPGGTTIPTSVFQTLVNIIDFGLSPDDAVNRPKFHHQWIPDTVDIEKGFPKITAEALEKMGYHLKTRGGIGRTDIIQITEHIITGIGDKRGDDDAEGY